MAHLFAEEEQFLFFRDMFGENVQIPQGAPILETMTRGSDGVVSQPSTAGLYVLPPAPGQDK